MESDKMATTTSKSESWPPSSLLQVDVANVRSLTESLEATGSHEPVTLQIQMAALLFLGDTAACHHLWQRTGGQDVVRQALSPWFKVAVALESNHAPTLWQAFRELEGTTTTSFSPETSTFSVSQYTRDIVQAFRMRIILPFSKQGARPPLFLLPLLGFASIEELDGFCQENKLDKAILVDSSLTMNQQARVAAFLSSPMAL